MVDATNGPNPANFIGTPPAETRTPTTDVQQNNAGMRQNYGAAPVSPKSMLLNRISLFFSGVKSKFSKLMEGASRLIKGPPPAPEIDINTIRKPVTFTQGPGFPLAATPATTGLEQIIPEDPGSSSETQMGSTLFRADPVYGNGPRDVKKLLGGLLGSVDKIRFPGNHITENTLKMINRSPTLKQDLEQMASMGWKVEIGKPDAYYPTGFNVDAEAGTLTISSDVAFNDNSVEAIVGTLAQATGMLMSGKQPDLSSKEAFLESGVALEAAGQFNFLQVSEEITYNNGIMPDENDGGFDMSTALVSLSDESGRNVGIDGIQRDSGYSAVTSDTPLDERLAIKDRAEADLAKQMLESDGTVTPFKVFVDGEWQEQDYKTYFDSIYDEEVARHVPTR